MARKMNMTSQKEEMPEKEGHETPLLDLSDAAVKQLIRSAKKRGYVTHDQINELLSVEEVKSEQIEDMLAKLSEIGINVVETKEADLAVCGKTSGDGGCLMIHFNHLESRVRACEADFWIRAGCFRTSRRRRGCHRTIR